MPFSDNQIQVSVLIAARNEERNIERCLKSLFALDFPSNQIEILIGDDDSSDRTAEIIRTFILDKPHFNYYKISDELSGLKGKTNVLAQLSHQAKGKYFFYCDADIAVPSTWIKAMLLHFKADTGVVIGLTRMRSNHLLADFISLEWLFILTIMRFMSLFKIRLTGLGNNMAVTKEAYFSVGGYEKIGFSIVEDYALFMAITDEKFGFIQTYTKSVMAHSEPVSSLSELMIQRKRWMHGIMQSPVFLRICLVLSALLLPLIGLISIWDPQRSISMLISNYIFISAIVGFAIILLRQIDLWKTIFFFWFYFMSICIIMLVIHILPGKTKWKGREY